MKSNFLGAVIAISAAIGSNLGVNVQKRSHNFESAKPSHLQRPYTRRPMWWIGMVLVILGSLGDFFALGFAAQTLVASLGGGSTIFANVVFAKFWLKQELYLTDILGVALVTIGVVVLALASSSEGKYTMDEIYELMQAPQFIMYVIITTAFVMSLLFRIHRSRAPILRAMPTPDETASEAPNKALGNVESVRDDLPDNPASTVMTHSITKVTADSSPSTERGSNSSESTSPFPSPIQNSVFMVPAETEDFKAVDQKISSLKKGKKPTLIIDRNLPLYWAAVSGTVGAQSVLIAKCVMELIFSSLNGDNQFKYFGSYVLVGAMTVTLLTQTHTLNLATMCGDTMSVFPVFQAFWIGMSNVSGIVFFQQAHTFNATQWAMFPSALLLVMIGILLISKHEKFGSAEYSMAMPLTLGSPRQHNIVAQSFQFTELAPQEQQRLAHSSPLTHDGIRNSSFSGDNKLETIELNDHSV